MGQAIGGFGVPLPFPSYLYPSELLNAPYDAASNFFGLAPGDWMYVPAGTWEVAPGGYSFLQWLDPVTGIWRTRSSSRGQHVRLKSDGYNFRVANLTGCPIAAVVTNAGSGYVQASTTCVANTGGSTWYPIVGGMVSVSTVSAGGGGYGIAPLVFIPAPPNPGVPATAIATISGGSVNAVSIVNAGAGYTTAPTAQILPNPGDPNIATITQATVTMALYGSGSIAAILCTNSGAPASPTLTIAGAGASATATAVRVQTVTGVSVSGGGGYGATSAALITVGGASSATPVNPNTAIDGSSYLPRPAQILLATLAGGSLSSVSTIFDGGLFTGTPTAVLLGSGTIPGTIGNVTLVLGSVNDTIFLQSST